MQISGKDVRWLNRKHGRYLAIEVARVEGLVVAQFWDTRQTPPMWLEASGTLKFEEAVPDDHPAMAEAVKAALTPRA